MSHRRVVVAMSGIYGLQRQNSTVCPLTRVGSAIAPGIFHYNDSALSPLNRCGYAIYPKTNFSINSYIFRFGEPTSDLSNVIFPAQATSAGLTTIGSR